jgi:hypothetical protein
MKSQWILAATIAALLGVGYLGYKVQHARHCASGDFCDCANAIGCGEP